MVAVYGAEKAPNGAESRRENEELQRRQQFVNFPFLLNYFSSSFGLRKRKFFD
jgi:hypothetical protein